ncbi:autotransporter domain-containing protein [Chlamydia sp. 12-01]|uniref:polymorphic outer membrane protein middle domain-containing protein n=1 Tax=Chlamydia sp. 12-01 TaxID=3002742 RepID=UPI0035D4103A
MKLSVYGFLLSSSLLSTHIAFAENSSVSPTSPPSAPSGASAKTATSEDLSTGFDGTSDVQPFTTKSSSNDAGTTYTLTKNITFANISTATTTASSSSSSGSQPSASAAQGNTEGNCFSNTAGDLTLYGHFHSLSFENISLTGKGAAISNTASGKTTILKTFGNLTFSNSPGSSVTNGKGAIYCQESSLQVINTTRIKFLNNHSTENGGAICYAPAPTPPPTPPVLQPQPQPQPQPAPPQPTSILSPLGSPILSSDPQPQPGSPSSSPGSSGPAAPAPAPAPAPVPAPGPGGQQSVQTTFTFNNNFDLTFTGNSSDKCGGAIYAQNLVIVSGGETLFTNNTAKEKGGAIAIADGGSISLSADSGVIVFEGNTEKNGESNAISLGSSAKITQLRATEWSRIYFYDPITGDQASTEKLTINGSDQPAPGTPTGPIVVRSSAAQPTPKNYTGTIVFSGRNRTNARALTQTSTLTQPVELAAGTFVLEDGALFSAKSFTQTNTNSIVLLEQNTSLQASDTVDLKNLWVGVTDVNSQAFAIVSATGGSGTVQISGPITLALSDPAFYENPDLAKQLDREFLKLTTTKGNITLNNQSDPVQQDIGDHLGYQGIWQLTWKDAPVSGGQGSEKVATLGWQPQGYLPTAGDTQSYTSLVPNSLWGMVSDVAAIQRLIEGEANSAKGKDIWGAGLSNFLKGKKTNKNRKFRNFSSGYAVGTSSQSLHRFKFSFGFCQLFGRAKDYAGARIHEKILSGSLYTQYDTELLPILKFLSGTSVFRPKILKQITDDFPVTFQAQFGYFYGDNSMKIKYLDATQANSSWENHCYSGDMGTSIAIPIHSKDGIIQMATPFVKVQSIYVYQKGFHEKGLRRRAFDHTYLTNISIPLGLKVHGDSPSKDLHYELSAAYIGDAYRHNPKNTTTPIVTNIVAIPWITTATNLQRHAARFQGAGDYSLTSYIHLFAQGSIELRKSARSYHANAGSSIHF